MQDEFYIDKNVKTKTHINVIKYIKKWILKPDDDLNIISIIDFSKRIEDYRLQKTGQPLCYGSIKSLFYTMQKERSDWDYKTMKRYKNKFWKQVSETSNLYNAEITEKISDMILFYVQGFIQKSLSNVIEMEVAKAIIVTLATNFRMSELLQLKKKHIKQIINGDILNIHIKKKLKGFRILAHNWLLEILLTHLEHVDDDCFVVKASRSEINKLIKKRTFVETDIKLGIQCIRKVNTTLLIQHGNIKIAQVFNRHTRSSVTAQYYNNKTYIAPTIDKIMKKYHGESRETHT